MPRTCPLVVNGIEHSLTPEDNALVELYKREDLPEADLPDLYAAIQRFHLDCIADADYTTHTRTDPEMQLPNVQIVPRLR